MSRLPQVHLHQQIALLHASPESLWNAPADTASEADLESTYSVLRHPIAVYGHIHRPSIRSVSATTVINTGSVSLSFDGDPRAAYLLLDDATPTIRRVDYDVDREIKALFDCRYPHADWIAKTLRSASSQPL